MMNAIPIFVGVVGKRELTSNPAHAADIERDVRSRFRAVFDHIDARLPETPKVLLTGLAAGADLIAAEEALWLDKNKRKRPNWLVLAVLPFDQSLYQQDFEPNQWSDYQSVIGDQRTRVKILPLLQKDGGAVVLARDLARSPQATAEQRDLRRRHYEQVGLWIADTANLLIAVMPVGEPVDKIGGTARIVACQRGGRPDSIARTIIAASSVLAPRPDLKRPPDGPIWLIDPSARPTGEPPVAILPPFQTEDERGRAYVEPALRSEAVPVKEKPDLDNRYPLANRAVIEIMRHIAAKSVEEATIDHPALQWPPAQDASAMLKILSRWLGNPGREAADSARHTFYLLSGLFLVAVLVFEIFAKFLSSNPWALLVYVALIYAIMTAYYLATEHGWQPIAEDLRAIREVLRVQRAWWDVGLTDRADYFHLQGADPDLAGVSEAARNIITWTILLSADGSAILDWRAVIDPNDRPQFSKDMTANEYPKDWVGNQRAYFWQRKDQRESKAQLGESLSWVLFATTLWLAFFLSAWLLLSEQLRSVFVGAVQSAVHDRSWISPLFVLGFLSGACGSWWVRGYFRNVRRPGYRISLSLGLGFIAGAFLFFMCLSAASLVAAGEWGLPGWACAGFLFLATIYAVYWFGTIRINTDATHLEAVVLGLGTVILLALVLQVMAARLGDQHAEEFVEHAVIIFVVFLPALGAMLRFLSEKLAVEAEALSYREAYGWFEHADRLLTALRPGNGNDADDAAARRIVRDLGILALRENEAWLKARRERPLSPFV